MISDRRRAAVRDAVFQGAVFGLAMGLLAKFSDQYSWGRAGVACLVAALVFGVLSTFCTRRRRREQFDLTDDLSAAQRKAALRAAERGKVPDDPLVRTRSAELARMAQREWQQWKMANTLIICLVFLSSIVMALTDSPWWWLAVPGVGAALIKGWVMPHRLERRAELLHGRG